MVSTKEGGKKWGRLNIELYNPNAGRRKQEYQDGGFDGQPL